MDVLEQASSNKEQSESVAEKCEHQEHHQSSPLIRKLSYRSCCYVVATKRIFADDVPLLY